MIIPVEKPIESTETNEYGSTCAGPRQHSSIRRMFCMTASFLSGLFGIETSFVDRKYRAPRGFLPSEDGLTSRILILQNTGSTAMSRPTDEFDDLITVGGSRVTNPLNNSELLHKKSVDLDLAFPACDAVKQCGVCGKRYHEYALRFCREDGNPLSQSHSRDEIPTGPLAVGLG